MKCPLCNTPNTAERQFCINCGQDLRNTGSYRPVKSSAEE